MNLPNILTIIRMFLVPIFPIFFFRDMQYNTAIAFGIVLVAGVTDFLDGYIARKYKMITKVGIVLDPLADKLMLVTVLISLTLKHELPPWIIFVVAVKECSMVLGAFILHRHHEAVIPANKYGKAATISFYVAVLTIAFHATFYMVFMILFVLLTMFAFGTYLSNFKQIRKESKTNKND